MWINLSERRSEYRATNQALSTRPRPLARAAGAATGGPPAPATRPGSSTGCTSRRPGRRRSPASWRRRSATSREDRARSGRCERVAAGVRAGARPPRTSPTIAQMRLKYATGGAPRRRHRSRAGHAHGVRPAVQPAPRDDGRGLHAGRDGLVRPGRGDPLAGRRARRLRPDPRRRVLPAPGGAQLPGPLRLRAEHDDGRPAGQPRPPRRGRGDHGRLRRRLDRRCGAADPGRDGGPGRQARHLADLPAQRAVRAAERLPARSLYANHNLVLYLNSINHPTLHLADWNTYSGGHGSGSEPTASTSPRRGRWRWPRTPAPSWGSTSSSRHLLRRRRLRLRRRRLRLRQRRPRRRRRSLSPRRPPPSRPRRPDRQGSRYSPPGSRTARPSATTAAATRAARAWSSGQPMVGPGRPRGPGRGRGRGPADPALGGRSPRRATAAGWGPTPTQDRARSSGRRPGARGANGQLSHSAAGPADGGAEVEHRLVPRPALAGGHEASASAWASRAAASAPTSGPGPGRCWCRPRPTSRSKAKASTARAVYGPMPGRASSAASVGGNAPAVAFDDRRPRRCRSDGAAVVAEAAPQPRARRRRAPRRTRPASGTASRNAWHGARPAPPGSAAASPRETSTAHGSRVRRHGRSRRRATPQASSER